MRIDGIELPDLVWRERLESFGVQGVAKLTRGGRPYIWEGVISGRKITLTGDDRHGWVAYSVYAQLKQRAEVVGATYLLEIGDISETVRFRHEDVPALSGAFVLDHTDDPEGDDYISNIEIRLAVV